MGLNAEFSGIVDFGSNSLHEKEFLSALVNGDNLTCATITDTLLNKNVSVMDIYEGLYRPTLYAVGKLWENNKITVAIEHIATAIVEDLMNEIFPRFISPIRKNRSIAVACVQGEEHQVGGRMVADYFESKGWDSYFLGANTSTQLVIDLLDLKKISFLALSLSINKHLPVLLSEIDYIREKSSIPILIGGQGLQYEGRDIESRYKDVTFLKDLYAIEAFIIGNAGK